MTKEEEAILAKEKSEAEEKAKAERENETDEERVAREAKEEEARSQQDFEAALKRERETGFKEGQAAQAFKERQKKRDEEGEEGEDEEKPLTRKDLGLIQDSLRKELHGDVLAQKARAIAGSQVETDLILEIHKNRSFPAGLSLDEQLDEARAIALSKPSMKARAEELARAERGKQFASGDAATTHRDSPQLDEPKLSSADVSAIKSAGFQWDGKTRLYVKNIGKNKILTYDPRTKTRKVIEK